MILCIIGLENIVENNKKMKWFERNIIWITFGIMALALMVQMIYIQQIKGELRLFKENATNQKRFRKV